MNLCRIGGELLAEYAASALTILPQREYGYQGGKMLISAANGDNDRLRRFVENLYLRTWGFLDNGKTQSDVNSLVTALGSAGQNNQAAMLQEAQDQATLLFNSDEYNGSQRTNEQFVADLYLAYLQRPPDGPGLAWWAGLLHSNQATRLQIRQDFANCGEFAALVAALHGVETSDYSRVDRFVNHLYAAATGSFPTTQQYTDEHHRFDVAEAQGVSAVREAGQSLGRQLLGASANNYRAELGTEEYVTRLYQTFLRRVPDGSFDSYVTQANSQGRSSVLEQFLAMSAYREQTEALSREVLWLVGDHLGTPRLIAERTGRVEGIKRRDYLPFGESADALNGRSAAFGYGTDTTRQGFTGYEKDGETGLNYAQARYYASGMGRFLSVDPLLTSSKPLDPQTWHRYSYTGNDPVNRVDPSGTDWFYRTTSIGRRIYEFHNTSLMPGYSRVTNFMLRATVDSRGPVILLVLNKWENIYLPAGSVTEARQIRDQFQREAAINYAVGALEAASLVADLSGGLSGTGVDRESNAYKEGRKLSTMMQGVAAAGGVGAVNFVVNKAVSKFGKGAAAALQGLKICCFEAGTPIHTAKGLVPIEQIQVGDKVLSYNEQTGQLEYKSVVQTFISVKQNIVKIKVRGEKRIFTTTTEHPFYVRKLHRARDGLATGDDGDEDGREWVTAAELRLGDKVRRPDGKWARVTGLWHEQTPITVYNFEVEGNHSYFVGDIGFLSHNCDIASGIKSLASRYKIGQCDMCAQAIAGFIKSKGGSGEIITLTGNGRLLSVSGNVQAATQGFHQGVRYGDMVYDNIHQNGIPYEQWLKDFIFHERVASGIVERTATVSSRTVF